MQLMQCMRIIISYYVFLIMQLECDAAEQKDQIMELEQDLRETKEILKHETDKARELLRYKDMHDKISVSIIIISVHRIIIDVMQYINSSAGCKWNSILVTFENGMSQRYKL